MLCEMCGRKEAEISAVVEGVMLTVCNDCSQYGNVVKIEKPKEIRETPIKRVSKRDEELESMEMIVDDYSFKIKKARESKGLKQEELAKKLAEKESLIHSLESGHIKPSLVLAKKLERFLGIKLIEEYKEQKKAHIDFRGGNITIGDLMKMRKK